MESSLFSDFWQQCRQAASLQLALQENILPFKSKKTSHHHGRKSTHKEKHNLRWQHFNWQGINRLQHSNSTFFLTESEHIYTHRLSPRSGITILHHVHIPTIHNYLRNSYIMRSPVPNTFASNIFPCYNTASAMLSSIFNISNVSFPGFHSTINTFFKLFIANKPVNTTCTETIQRKKSHHFSRDRQYITNPRKPSEVINF